MVFNYGTKILENYRDCNPWEVGKDSTKGLVFYKGHNGSRTKIKRYSFSVMQHNIFAIITYKVISKVFEPGFYPLLNEFIINL